MQSRRDAAAPAELLPTTSSFDRLLELAVDLRDSQQNKPDRPSIAVAALPSPCTWASSSVSSTTTDREAPGLSSGPG
jgi:hypothetical protein